MTKAGIGESTVYGPRYFEDLLGEEGESVGDIREDVGEGQRQQWVEEFRMAQVTPRKANEVSKGDFSDYSALWRTVGRQVNDI